MAEQFLKRPQVRAAGQQMGREAVAKRVRSQRIGQPQTAPRRRTARRTKSGLSGPPRAPTNNGASPLSG